MSDRTATLPKSNFGGRPAPRPLRNDRGRVIGYGYGDGDDGGDIAARWAVNCDHSALRTSEAVRAGRVARYRDITVLWVADRRVFVLVNPPESIRDRTLARSLATSQIFIDEANDQYLPIEAVLVVGRTVGPGFVAALHESFAGMRVYSGTDPLKIVQAGADPEYRQGGFRTDGHQRVDGAMTPSQRRIIARELRDAHGRGWAYPGEPGTGRTIELDDRIRTLDLVDQLYADFRDRLTADPGHLDLVALASAVGHHHEPGVLVEALLGMLDLSSISSITDLVHDEEAGSWMLAAPTARTLYTATGHHTVTGNLATRPARFGTPRVLLAGQAIEPLAPVTGGSSSGEFAAAAAWLAETAYDLSRPGQTRRPPIVLAAPESAADMRAAADRHVEALDIGGAGIAAQIERMFAEPGEGDAQVVEVRERPEQMATGFGRTAPVADLPAGADPAKAALAMLRSGARKHLTNRPRGPEPRSIEIPPAHRDAIAARLLQFGPEVAQEHADWAARNLVDAVTPPPAHGLTEEDLVRALLASTDAVHFVANVHGRDLSVEDAFEPVPSLSGLAREMDHPDGPRLTVVKLRAADGSETTMALVAADGAVVWVDFDSRRLLPAAEIPDPVRHAASATAVQIGEAGQIIPIAPAVAAPDPQSVELGGDLLQRINEQSAGDPRLTAARDVAYQIAAHLVVSRHPTLVGRAVAELAAESSEVATAVELMTVLFDQLASVLADQANPGQDGPAAFAGVEPVDLWEAASPGLQDFLVRHRDVVWEIFTKEFLDRYPNFFADLGAERESTFDDLRWVPVLDRHGLPLVTLDRYADELLNPDPSTPRLDGSIVPARITLRVTPGPVRRELADAEGALTEISVRALVAPNDAATPVSQPTGSVARSLPRSNFVVRRSPAGDRLVPIDAGQPSLGPMWTNALSLPPLQASMDGDQEHPASLAGLHFVGRGPIGDLPLWNTWHREAVDAGVGLVILLPDGVDAQNQWSYSEDLLETLREALPAPSDAGVSDRPLLFVPRLQPNVETFLSSLEYQPGVIRPVFRDAPNPDLAEDEDGWEQTHADGWTLRFPSGGTAHLGWLLDTDALHDAFVHFLSDQSRPVIPPARIAGAVERMLDKWPGREIVVKGQSYWAADSFDPDLLQLEGIEYSGFSAPTSFVSADRQGVYPTSQPQAFTLVRKDNSYHIIQRIYFRPNSVKWVADEQLLRLQNGMADRAAEGFSEIYDGVRVLDGSELHQHILVVDSPERAHRTVELISFGARSTSISWGIEIPPAVLVHEIGHPFLPDRYADQRFGVSQRRVIYPGNYLMASSGPVVLNLFSSVQRGVANREGWTQLHPADLVVWSELVSTAIRRPLPRVRFADGVLERALHEAGEHRRHSTDREIFDLPKIGVGGVRAHPGPVNVSQSRLTSEGWRLRAAPLNLGEDGRGALPQRTEPRPNALYPPEWSTDEVVYHLRVVFVRAAGSPDLDAAGRGIADAPDVRLFSGVYNGVRSFIAVRGEAAWTKDGHIDSKRDTREIIDFWPDERQDDVFRSRTDDSSSQNNRPTNPEIRADSGVGVTRNDEPVAERVTNLEHFRDRGYGNRRFLTGMAHRTIGGDGRVIDMPGVQVFPSDQSDDERGTFMAEVFFLDPRIAPEDPRARALQPEVTRGLPPDDPARNWTRWFGRERNRMFPDAWTTLDVELAILEAHRFALLFENISSEVEGYTWVGVGNGVRIVGRTLKGRIEEANPTWSQPPVVSTRPGLRSDLDVVRMWFAREYSSPISGERERTIIGFRPWFDHAGIGYDLVMQVQFVGPRFGRPDRFLTDALDRMAEETDSPDNFERRVQIRFVVGEQGPELSVGEEGNIVHDGHNILNLEDLIAEFDPLFDGDGRIEVFQEHLSARPDALVPVLAGRFMTDASYRERAGDTDPFLTEVRARMQSQHPRDSAGLITAPKPLPYETRVQWREDVAVEHVNGVRLSRRLIASAIESAATGPLVGGRRYSVVASGGPGRPQLGRSDEEGVVRQTWLMPPNWPLEDVAGLIADTIHTGQRTPVEGTENIEVISKSGSPLVLTVESGSLFAFEYSSWHRQTIEQQLTRRQNSIDAGEVIALTAIVHQPDHVYPGYTGIRGVVPLYTSRILYGRYGNVEGGVFQGSPGEILGTYTGAAPVRDDARQSPENLASWRLMPLPDRDDAASSPVVARFVSPIRTSPHISTPGAPVSPMLRRFGAPSAGRTATPSVSSPMSARIRPLLSPLTPALGWRASGTYPSAPASPVSATVGNPASVLQGTLIPPPPNSGMQWMGGGEAGAHLRSFDRVARDHGVRLVVMSPDAGIDELAEPQQAPDDVPLVLTMQRREDILALYRDRPFGVVQPTDDDVRADPAVGVDGLSLRRGHFELILPDGAAFLLGPVLAQRELLNVLEVFTESQGRLPAAPQWFQRLLAEAIAQWTPRAERIDDMRVWVARDFNQALLTDAVEYAGLQSVPIHTPFDLGVALVQTPVRFLLAREPDGGYHVIQRVYFEVAPVKWLTPEQLEDLRRGMVARVSHGLSRLYEGLVLPDGSRFHHHIVVVDAPESAHRTIRLLGPGSPAGPDAWPVDVSAFGAALFLGHPIIRSRTFWYAGTLRDLRPDSRTVSSGTDHSLAAVMPDDEGISGSSSFRNVRLLSGALDDWWRHLSMATDGGTGVVSAATRQASPSDGPTRLPLNPEYVRARSRGDRAHRTGMVHRRLENGRIHGVGGVEVIPTSDRDARGTYMARVFFLHPDIESTDARAEIWPPTAGEANAFSRWRDRRENRMFPDGWTPYQVELSILEAHRHAVLVGSRTPDVDGNYRWVGIGDGVRIVGRTVNGMIEVANLTIDQPPDGLQPADHPRLLGDSRFAFEVSYAGGRMADEQRHTPARVHAWYDRHGIGYTIEIGVKIHGLESAAPEVREAALNQLEQLSREANADLGGPHGRRIYLQLIESERGLGLQLDDNQGQLRIDEWPINTIRQLYLDRSVLTGSGRAGLLDRMPQILESVITSELPQGGASGELSMEDAVFDDLITEVPEAESPSFDQALIINDFLVTPEDIELQEDPISESAVPEEIGDDEIFVVLDSNGGSGRPRSGRLITKSATAVAWFMPDGWKIRDVAGMVTQVLTEGSWNGRYIADGIHPIRIYAVRNPDIPHLQISHVEYFPPSRRNVARLVREGTAPAGGHVSSVNERILALTAIATRPDAVYSAEVAANVPAGTRFIFHGEYDGIIGGAYLDGSFDVVDIFYGDVDVDPAIHTPDEAIPTVSIEPPSPTTSSSTLEYETVTVAGSANDVTQSLRTMFDPPEPVAGQSSQALTAAANETVTDVRGSAASAGVMPLADCVVLAITFGERLYGRRPGGAQTDAALPHLSGEGAAPVLSVARGQLVTDGFWTSTTVNAIESAAATSRPGESVFVIAVRPGEQQAHALILHRASDGPHWFDLQAPEGSRVLPLGGERPAALGESVRLLAAFTDAGGRPQPMTTSAAPSTTSASALVDTPASPEVGASIRRILRGERARLPEASPAAGPQPSEPDLGSVADRRPDVRTVFLPSSGDDVELSEITRLLMGERASDILNRGIPGSFRLSGGSDRVRRPVRIVTAMPAGPAGEAVLERLRRQFAKSGREAFAPEPGTRVVFEHGDLAVVDGDARPARWVSVGADRPAQALGYETDEHGRLGRDLTSLSLEPTASELAWWMVRDSALPAELERLPGESQRPFGLEIEFVFDSSLSDSERNQRLQRIVDDLARLGLTQQTRVGEAHSAKQAGYSSRRSGWHLELDPTVDGEIVSPILPYRNAEEREHVWYDVATVLGVIRRHGGRSDGRVGGHVHVGIGDYARNVDHLSRLVRTFVAHQDSLYRLATGNGNRFHRGTANAIPLRAPLPHPMAAEGENWVWPQFGGEGTGNRDQALSHVALSATHQQDAAADHLEFRIWDGDLSLGGVRARVDLSRALTDSVLRPRQDAEEGNAELGSTFLGPDPYGTPNAAAQRWAIDLFPGEATAIRGRVSQLWERTSWQPPNADIIRAGQFFFATPDAVTLPAWERFRPVAAGFPDLQVVIHPARDEGVLDGRSSANLALEIMLERWAAAANGRTTSTAASRTVVVAGADSSRAADLERLVERFGVALVRPIAGAGYAEPVSVSGWASRTGWELVTRDPGGELSRTALGGVFGPADLRRVLEQVRAARASAPLRAGPGADVTQAADSVSLLEFGVADEAEPGAVPDTEAERFAAVDGVESWAGLTSAEVQLRIEELVASSWVRPIPGGGWVAESVGDTVLDSRFAEYSGRSSMVRRRIQNVAPAVDVTYPVRFSVTWIDGAYHVIQRVYFEDSSIDGVSPEQLAELQRSMAARAERGLAAVYGGARLPDGSELHPHMVVVSSRESAHRIVRLTPAGGRASTNRWPVNIPDAVLAHELGHELLPDRYASPSEAGLRHVYLGQWLMGSNVTEQLGLDLNRMRTYGSRGGFGQPHPEDLDEWWRHISAAARTLDDRPRIPRVTFAEGTLERVLDEPSDRPRLEGEPRRHWRGRDAFRWPRHGIGGVRENPHADRSAAPGRLTREGWRPRIPGSQDDVLFVSDLGPAGNELVYPPEWSGAEVAYHARVVVARALAAVDQGDELPGSPGVRLITNSYNGVRSTVAIRMRDGVAEIADFWPHHNQEGTDPPLNPRLRPDRDSVAVREPLLNLEEVRSRGSGHRATRTGMVHRTADRVPGVEVIPEPSRDARGTYLATVSFLDPRVDPGDARARVRHPLQGGPARRGNRWVDRVPNRMFPDHWTTLDVELAILEAHWFALVFDNYERDRVGDGYTWVGIGNGVRIVGRTETGTIQAANPTLDQPPAESLPPRNPQPLWRPPLRLPHKFRLSGSEERIPISFEPWYDEHGIGYFINVNVSIPGLENRPMQVKRNVERILAALGEQAGGDLAGALGRRVLLRFVHERRVDGLPLTVDQVGYLYREGRRVTGVTQLLSAGEPILSPAGRAEILDGILSASADVASGLIAGPFVSDRPLTVPLPDESISRRLQSTHQIVDGDLIGIRSVEVTPEAEEYPWAGVVDRLLEAAVVASGDRGQPRLSEATGPDDQRQLIWLPPAEWTRDDIVQMIDAVLTEGQRDQRRVVHPDLPITVSLSTDGTLESFSYEPEIRQEIAAAFENLSDRQLVALTAIADQPRLAYEASDIRRAGPASDAAFTLPGQHGDFVSYGRHGTLTLYGEYGDVRGGVHLTRAGDVVGYFADRRTVAEWSADDRPIEPLPRQSSEASSFDTWDALTPAQVDERVRELVDGWPVRQIRAGHWVAVDFDDRLLTAEVREYDGRSVPARGRAGVETNPATTSAVRFAVAWIDGAHHVIQRVYIAPSTIDNLSPTQIADLGHSLAARAEAGLTRAYDGVRLPDGSRLYQHIVVVDSAESAHRTVWLTRAGDRPSSVTWPVSAATNVLAHELGHELLPDRYTDSSGQGLREIYFGQWLMALNRVAPLGIGLNSLQTISPYLDAAVPPHPADLNEWWVRISAMFAERRPGAQLTFAEGTLERVLSEPSDRSRAESGYRRHWRGREAFRWPGAEGATNGVRQRPVANGVPTRGRLTGAGWVWQRPGLRRARSEDDLVADNAIQPILPHRPNRVDRVARDLPPAPLVYPPEWSADEVVHHVRVVAARALATGDAGVEVPGSPGLRLLTGTYDGVRSTVVVRDTEIVDFWPHRDQDPQRIDSPSLNPWLRENDRPPVTEPLFNLEEVRARAYGNRGTRTGVVHRMVRWDEISPEFPTGKPGPGTEDWDVVHDHTGARGRVVPVRGVTVVPNPSEPVDARGTYAATVFFLDPRISPDDPRARVGDPGDPDNPLPDRGLSRWGRREPNRMFPNRWKSIDVEFAILEAHRFALTFGTYRDAPDGNGYIWVGVGNGVRIVGRTAGGMIQDANPTMDQPAAESLPPGERYPLDDAGEWRGPYELSGSGRAVTVRLGAWFDEREIGYHIDVPIQFPGYRDLDPSAQAQVDESLAELARQAGQDHGPGFGRRILLRFVREQGGLELDWTRTGQLFLDGSEVTQVTQLLGADDRLLTPAHRAWFMRDWIVDHPVEAARLIGGSFTTTTAPLGHPVVPTPANGRLAEISRTIRSAHPIAVETTPTGREFVRELISETRPADNSASADVSEEYRVRKYVIRTDAINSLLDARPEQSTESSRGAHRIVVSGGVGQPRLGEGPPGEDGRRELLWLPPADWTRNDIVAMIIEVLVGGYEDDGWIVDSRNPIQVQVDGDNNVVTSFRYGWETRDEIADVYEQADDRVLVKLVGIAQRPQHVFFARDVSPGTNLPRRTNYILFGEYDGFRGGVYLSARSTILGAFEGRPPVPFRVPGDPLPYQLRALRVARRTYADGQPTGVDALAGFLSRWYPAGFRPSRADPDEIRLDVDAFVREAIAGDAAGARPTPSWADVMAALEEMDGKGLLLATAHNGEALVLQFGAGRDLSQIVFRIGGPVMESADVGGPPPAAVVAFDDCSTLRTA